MRKTNLQTIIDGTRLVGVGTLPALAGVARTAAQFDRTSRLAYEALSPCFEAARNAAALFELRIYPEEGDDGE